MAGKKGRKSRTSFGVQGSPKKCRTSVGVKRVLNQQKAWEQGKKVMLTVPNPDSSATNMRFIKVNARAVWGLPPMLRKKQNNAS
jgi:hypothetical protein